MSDATVAADALPRTTRRANAEFPRYGWVGLAMIAVLMLNNVARRFGWLPEWSDWVNLISSWTTPVCWWGLILFCDAWIFRREGNSWLKNERGLFALMCILSVIFWCIFEAYNWDNTLMPGWKYIGLPESTAEKFIGYPIAFATIMPGMFVVTRLVKSYGVFANARMPRVRWNRTALVAVMLFGLFCIVFPPFLRADDPTHLVPQSWRLAVNSAWWGLWWGAVWCGYVFFLEPINYWRGGQSIFRDWEQGKLGRTLQFFLAGAICGLIWEFWNYWAFTKWIYTFNLAQHLKLFEMPVLGFFGFPPFNLEYFVMFHFVALFFTNEDKLKL